MLMSHRAKKSLGQHFLTDQFLAQNIVSALSAKEHDHVLEVGPGQGVLTQYLIKSDFDFKAIELDDQLVPFLKKKFPVLEDKIIHLDFLKANLDQTFDGEPFHVIGNFPYNISSQIIFKIIKHRDLVPEMVGMFQKEVAERIVAPPGSKTYGVISVLTQAYYSGRVIYQVPPESFDPPPRVNSAVIILQRNKKEKTDYNPSLFKSVVKTAFKQRRKMLRNSLKSLIPEGTDLGEELLKQRPEQLSVQDFIEITKKIERDELRAKGNE